MVRRLQRVEEEKGEEDKLCVGGGGSLGRDGMDEMNVEGMGRVGEDVMKGEMEGKGGEGRCEARKKRQEGGRGELKGKCTKYITNLSPLAPCPPLHTHSCHKKAKGEGGTSLDSQQSITHTERETTGFTDWWWWGGCCLERQGGRGEMKLN